MTDGVWKGKDPYLNIHRVKEGEQGYSLSLLLTVSMLAKLNNTDGTPREGWEHFNWVLPMEFTR